MRNTLLLSVAATALIAGMGLAPAQPSREASPPAPAAAQQGAPTERVTPRNEPKSGAELTSPDAGQLRKQGKAPEQGKAPGKSTGANSEAKGDAQPGPGSKTTADPKAPTTAQRTAPAAERSGEAPAAGGHGVDRNSSEKAVDRTPSTKGRAAAGAPANLSTEQRTTIRTVLDKQDLRRESNVNFSVSVGSRVPRTVRFHPVPVELVQIYPSWRGYDVVLVGDRILVINPRTREIVAVLDA